LTTKNTEKKEKKEDRKTYEYIENDLPTHLLKTMLKVVKESLVLEEVTDQLLSKRGSKEPRLKDFEGKPDFSTLLLIMKKVVTRRDDAYLRIIAVLEDEYNKPVYLSVNQYYEKAIRGMKEIPEYRERFFTLLLSYNPKHSAFADVITQVNDSVYSKKAAEEMIKSKTKLSDQHACLIIRECPELEQKVTNLLRKQSKLKMAA
jgi:hypothetical protein